MARGRRSALTASTGEVLGGLWRFEALHPEWTEDQGGKEGWEPNVAWWAVASPEGLILVDPLVADWDELDQLVRGQRGCAGIIRTLHWHQRSIAEAATRYGVDVWAMPAPRGTPRQAFDQPARSGQETLGAVRAFALERADEIALWLPGQAALLFGDAMLRRGGGELIRCPDSWQQPEGGPAQLRSALGRLGELPVEHVLVSHGPLVLGDGLASLRAAIT